MSRPPIARSQEQESSCMRGLRVKGVMISGSGFRDVLAQGLGLWVLEVQGEGFRG